MFVSAAAALLLAGCGGGAGPRLAHKDAATLILLADRIAREAPCAQARDIQTLSRRRIALVNAHRVPAALQEPLSSGVNALVVQTPPCLPPVPAATITPPVVTQLPTQGAKHPHKDKQKHGHGEGGD